MGCDVCREGLSARLDGEPAPVPERELDSHLAGCADCRRWFDEAAMVTRLARTGAAAPVPDVTEAVLPAAPGPWRGRLTLGLRVALGVLATAQIVLGLLQLTTLQPVTDSHVHGTTVDGATPGHLWHESAAWNLAVGAAFLWVVARRSRPVGIVPILTVFLAVLALLSAADILAGRVESVRLASHAFVLTGYLIVLALARRSPELPPPGQQSLPDQRPASQPPEPAELPPGVVPFPGRGRSAPAARTSHPRAA